ncbi:aggregation-promoting factor C-terminal-like domain-containing protein [Agromyces aerolatus]|uniref:aggregation-promoting factor C-terminal-like domain-containing protein n=1 Tax=Agromyces sp. LY-1074 TaxID=3074080 RepID=UPI00285B349C|nr:MULTISPECIES: hypothetical protein [unclassified Agromyces]MDR5700053.1 hypothetical protein [Agromyces sp. LY-1074]MDR5706579.1 hypothetical protein [Agromyces sp. LY-1358]
MVVRRRMRRARWVSSRPAAPVIGALAAATLLPIAVLGPAAPASANDLPTWDDVNAAKQDVASREAEAARIDTLIGGLEVETGRLGDAAVSAASDAATAEAASATAAERAGRLGTDADTAAAHAQVSAQRFGYSAALLARTGGADTTLQLFFAQGQPGGDDLLTNLSRVSRLTDLYTAEAQRAEVARADAQSLREQADLAASERDRLAGEAEAKAGAARAAHEAAERELTAQQSSLDTLYAQLASLRDRSVDLERQVRGAEQAAAEAAERERVAREAAGTPGGDTGTAPPPAGVIVDPVGAKAYARSAVARYGWGEGEYQCLVWLWERESNWRADAYNRSSGAYGIPQSLPGSKMAAAGTDWRTNAATQIEWGLSYISGRYGAPCGAWAHSERVNWY